jgi:hypothetical protein
MIDRTPEVAHLAADLHVHLFQMPPPMAEAADAATHWRRMSAANSGSERFHQSLTVSWQMSIPRSSSRSSTLRGDNGDHTYIITTSRITSGDELS